MNTAYGIIMLAFMSMNLARHMVIELQCLFCIIKDMIPQTLV